MKVCKPRQENRNSPPTASLHPWEWPAPPWQHLHIDFAGPVKGKMLFVLTDAHSKWAEVFTMTTTTLNETIALLRETFAQDNHCVTPEAPPVPSSQ